MVSTRPASPDSVRPLAGEAQRSVGPFSVPSMAFPPGRSANFDRVKGQRRMGMGASICEDGSKGNGLRYLQLFRWVPSGCGSHVGARRFE